MEDNDLIMVDAPGRTGSPEMPLLPSQYLQPTPPVPPIHQGSIENYGRPMPPIHQGPIVSYRSPTPPIHQGPIVSYGPPTPPQHRTITSTITSTMLIKPDERIHKPDEQVHMPGSMGQSSVQAMQRQASGAEDGSNVSSDTAEHWWSERAVRRRRKLGLRHRW